MFTKTLIVAAPVLASAALVAGGLGASTVQANASGGGDPTAPVADSATTLASSSTTCSGLAQKTSSTGGTSGWIGAGSDTGSIIVPGTILSVHGPSSGRDVLSVNLSAESFLESGSEGRVKVLFDGVPLAPSDLNAGSTFDATSYSTFAQNYCRKIGPGFHHLRVVISDYDFGAAGSFSFYLHDPMVHVETSQ